MPDYLVAAVAAVREAILSLDRAAQGLDRAHVHPSLVRLIDGEAGRLRELHQLLLDTANERDGEAKGMSGG
jgi:hypothetical protein